MISSRNFTCYITITYAWQGAMKKCLLPPATFHAIYKPVAF